MKNCLYVVLKVIAFATFVILAWRYFDGPAFVEGWRLLASSPGWLAGMAAAYSAAFLCRAVAWRQYLPKEQRPALSLCWHGLIYSLLLNHILPIKAGDAARVGVLWRGGTSALLAVHSVAAMRALDMAALGGMAAAGAPLLLGAKAVHPSYAVGLIGLAAAVLLVLPQARRLPWPLARSHAAIAADALQGARGAAIAALTLAGWVLEAAVIYAVAKIVLSPAIYMSGTEAGLSVLEAVWANAFTIAGGLFYIGPGGIGGYESAMSFALSRTGITWPEALNIALISHSFKFIYSYATGLVTWLLLPIGRSDWKRWRAMAAAAKRNQKETDST